MKEGNLTTARQDPFRCVQVKTENSSALPLFSCRTACFSLWGRGRFAVPAVTQAKGRSHQWGHLPCPAMATSLGWTLKEEKDEAKFSPGTHGTGCLPRADPGATQPPKSRAATDCWREEKVGWELDHAQRWVIITCCSEHVVAFSLPTPRGPTTLFC